MLSMYAKPQLLASLQCLRARSRKRALLPQTLDLVLVSPVLLPVFAVIAIGQSGKAAKAGMEKASAVSDMEAARKAQQVAEDKVAALQTQLTDERKQAQRKLELQKEQMIKRLKEGREEYRRNYDNERKKTIELEATIRR